MTREEYGKLYHMVFGKAAGREACRQGWDRWQQVWKSGYDAVVMHPLDSPPLAPQENDHCIVAATGELRFLARVAAAYIARLPALWLAAPSDLVRPFGLNPRQCARTFVHNGLVDGYVADPVIAPAMASAIAWLLSTMEGVPVKLTDYHLIGYDISHVPGPPGRKTMFNFRAMLQQDAGAFKDGLDAARSLPLPDWQPPPH